MSDEEKKIHREQLSQLHRLKNKDKMKNYNFIYYNTHIKTTIRYDNAKIYKITSNNTDDVYIGSTCRTLEDRFRSHKNDYSRWIKNNECKYLIAYEILKYSDAQITLVENYPCNSKIDLLLLEGKYQTNTDNCINKSIAGSYLSKVNSKLYTTTPVPPVSTPTPIRQDIPLA